MFGSIEEKYGNKVVLINNKVNGGYGQGNNLGVEVAKAPIILIMNPDVRLVKPIFKRILSLFERRNIAIAGMQQYESLLKRSQSFLMLREDLCSLFLYAVYTIGYLHPKENREFSSKNFLLGYHSFIYTCDKLGLDLHRSRNKMLNMYRFLEFYSWARGDKLKVKYYKEIIKLIKNNI